MTVSRLLLLLFVCCYDLSSSSSIRNSNTAVFSPINELAPSLAASVAGGTVIAVRSRVPPSDDSCKPANAVLSACNEDEDCIVILFRYPDVSQKNSVDEGHNLTHASVFGSFYTKSTDLERDSKDSETNGPIPWKLSPLNNGPINHPYLQSNNNARILHAPTGLLLATTGFKPDTSHLLQIAAGRVLSRNSIYDPISKSIDPHRLVREDLSPILMDASSSEGGRPFGVQCLVLGQSCIRRDLLELYTMDPSGGWRSHVGDAVIGKGAERVRAALVKYRASAKNEMKEEKGWNLALSRAMFAAVDTFDINEDDKSVVERSRSSMYGAIVVFGSAGRSGNGRCAAIHPKIVNEYYKRRIARILQDKKQ